jgi:hypothetical protein
VPLDHYVSQVHLRRFYSPQLGNRMFAIRKADLHEFTPDAQSVCRIQEGSTNVYLREPRVVEEFLKGIEPKYNDAVARVVEDSFDSECIYVLSGFIAYVATCSPAGMRLHSEPLGMAVEETARMSDAAGEIPAPPKELGGASFVELLDREVLKVGVDAKYAQGIGIAQILKIATSFGNFSWDVLINEYDDSPYFSSDFPVAVEATPEGHVAHRIVPLTPNVALRIRPRIEPRSRHDFSYRGFQRRTVRVSRANIRTVNRHIVRSAEKLVFFRDQADWVRPFIAKNAPFRVQTKSERIPTGQGTILWSKLQVVDTRKEIPGGWGRY